MEFEDKTIKDDENTNNYSIKKYNKSLAILIIIIIKFFLKYHNKKPLKKILLTGWRGTIKILKTGWI